VDSNYGFSKKFEKIYCGGKLLNGAHVKLKEAIETKLSCAEKQ